MIMKFLQIGKVYKKKQLLKLQTDTGKVERFRGVLLILSRDLRVQSVL